MIRREFIKLATLTGATGLVPLGAVEAFKEKETSSAIGATETKTIVWRVHGFTCITCAVGLEVMLRQQKGVESAQASYPGAIVTIQFHPEIVSESALRSFITDIGFTADEQKG